MIRLGLVGFGKWGQHYINAAQGVDDVKITAVCRNDISKFPDSFRDSYLVTSSLAEVLDSGVHGVIIATPPDSHLSLAEACLKRKIPFLLEKPMALHGTECAELVRVATLADVPFQVNHIHLYAPAYVKLRSIVQSWDSPLYIVSQGGNHGPFRDYDSFHDYAPHDVAMILGLFGERTRVSSFNIEALPQKPGGSIFRLTMNAGSSRSTSYVGNGFQEKHRTLNVISLNTGDCISYNDTAQFKLLLNGQPLHYSETSPLVSSIQSFRNMLYGIMDWRTDFDFYNRIYHITATES